jgi:outer membrane receptor protein involved in Fe transport
VSWRPELRRQPVITAPVYQYSGFYNGPLIWRGNAGFDWTLGRWSILYNAQFYDSYKVNNAEETQSSVNYDVLSQGSARIPSQLYHDLYVSYTIPGRAGVLGNVQISAGVQNLFDKSPPIIATLSPANSGYSNYGDPRLRRFTLSLKKSFGR